MVYSYLYVFAIAWNEMFLIYLTLLVASGRDTTSQWTAYLSKARDVSATVPTDYLSPGSYRLWTRACVDYACGAGAFAEFSI